MSGSVGLIYQVAWKHIFTTVFGSTTYAVSVVISVFMAGVAHAMKGDKEEALAFFEPAVARDPGSAAARHSLAVFLAGEGRFAQAVPHLEKLVELRPNSAQAHSMLGEAYRSTGDQEAAQRHLSRAAELRAAQ